MKISVKALLWAAFCMLISAGSANAQGTWTAKGWLAQSYTANPASPHDKYNGPVTWTDRSNEYQMNELYMYLERSTDTGGDGWDLGMRVDTMYGTSSRFVNQTGWELQGDGTQNWNGNNRFYGLCMPNLYAELAYNDLKVKIGRFVSPVGYMTVGSPNNFFNALPYTYQYGEPFTHTGIIGTYTMTDKLTVGAGVTKGWDNVSDSYNPTFGALTTSTYLLDSGASIATVQVFSNEPSGSSTSGGQSPRFLNTFVYTKPLTENLQYVFQSDFGSQQNATAASGNNSDGHSAKWYGANQYLLYTINEKWAFGANFEWFRDQEGFRTQQLNLNTGTGSTRSAPLAGYAGNFYQITMGPKWKPTENLMIRPNARWDWYNGDLGNNGTRPLPFDDGNSGTQFIFGTDVVLFF
ncbi:MAG: porin [Planctomycetia bacterium]|nr:porin [Planctomycetia bacterium]